ncbi:TetR/AcrR family transcriptional regulator [Stutzerimonas nitrititolerans]|uniref:TetR/AcrR family transcriptional regulator n=1 Tax=Stutzerimonas nitrititolerans TaxID=2482751 RepID=UPI0028AE81DE|nr:TetR/AcrR family transcriptional regulator [Stutzerimonas nitrititolerans]
MSGLKAGAEKKQVSRLGRRRFSELGEVENKELILNEAEKLFAMQGYLGTSLKQIALQANVTQALITYYYGTKQNLFLEIYRRGLADIARNRQQYLDDLKARGSDYEISDIIRTYLKPQFEHRDGGEAWKYFARLQSRLVSEPDEVTVPLRKELYDEAIKAYIEEMMACEGKEHRVAISWGTVFMISMILYMLRGVDRIGELTDGSIHAESEDDMIEKMTLFIAGGINALK